MCAPCPRPCAAWLRRGAGLSRRAPAALAAALPGPHCGRFLALLRRRRQRAARFALQGPIERLCAACGQPGERRYSCARVRNLRYCLRRCDKMAARGRRALAGYFVLHRGLNAAGRPARSVTMVACLRFRRARCCSRARVSGRQSGFSLHCAPVVQCNHAGAAGKPGAAHKRRIACAPLPWFCAQFVAGCGAVPAPGRVANRLCWNLH